jgi:hypothetical protein
MTKSGKSESVPKRMQAKYDEIVVITDRVCAERLNAEFAQLARYATAALCRKRPSPLERGRAGSWACGIVYALGFVNFMFDKSQEYYISAQDLCAAFDVSKGTGYAKSKQVRDMLDMTQFDTNWYLPSMLDDNPLAWYIMVNGFIVDARSMPREVQELAYEKGLIPYIPGERPDTCL